VYSGQYAIPNVIAGNYYSWSFYYKINTPKKLRLQIALRDNVLTFLTGVTVDVPFTVSSDWQRVIIETYPTVAPVNTYCASLYFYDSVSPSACTLFIDALQFEPTLRATPYLDGSLGNAHSWTGTAHASQSNRLVTGVSVANPDNIRITNKGTIMCWIRTENYYTNYSNAYINRIIPSSGSENIRIYFNGYNLFFSWGTTNINTLISPAKNTWTHVALTGDGNTAKFYVNGKLVSTTSLQPLLDNAYHYIGSLDASLALLGGLLDDYCVLSRPLSDAEISAVYAYGKKLGLYEVECSDQDTIYIQQNAYNYADISHLYYRSNAGAWSNNLLTQPLPQKLLPEPVSVGDCLYIGCDTATTTPETFMSAIPNSIFLDLATGASTALNYYVEYWNGSTWVSSSYNDDTGGLVQTGCIRWTPSTSIAIAKLSTAVAGAPDEAPYAYWHRLRMVNYSSTYAPVIRDYPHITARPYIDMCGDDIGGDLDALLKITALSRPITANYVHGLMVGARHLSRGEGFSAFHNFSPSNNSRYVETYLLSSYSQYSYGAYPGGACLSIPSLGSTGYTEFYAFRFDTSQYAGKYRIFLVGGLYSGSSSDAMYIRFRLSVFNGLLNDETPLTYTDYLQMTKTATYSIYDFGEIEFPDMDVQAFVLTMEGYKPSATACDFKYYHLVLIPSDEWVVMVNSSSYYGDGKAVVIDSAEDLKRGLRAYHYDTVSGSPSNPILPNDVFIRGKLRANPGETVRLWYFNPWDDFNTYSNVFATWINANEQYLLARGDE
jgi:hypothetical protein